jgi:hypothetical protein
MNNFDTLLFIFGREVQKSETLLFVACEILAKKLINRELIAEEETDSIDKTAEIVGIKQKALLEISRKLYEIIAGPKRPTLQQYMVRSCVNAISQCINATITCSSAPDPTFFSYFDLLAPDFRLPDCLTRGVAEAGSSLVEASSEPLRPHHELVIAVFISLLDYIVNSAYFINYYYYRRNLNFFRNTYLGNLFGYSLFTLKTVFKHSLPPSTDLTTVNLSIRPVLQLL